MKSFFIIILFLVGVRSFCEENLFIFRYTIFPKTVFTLTDNDSLVDVEKAQRTFDRLGLKYRWGDYKSYYGLYNFFSIDFPSEQMKTGIGKDMKIEKNRNIVLSDEELKTINWNKESTFNAIGINIKGLDSSYVFAFFLLSAYLQEAIPEYNTNNLLFYDLLEKENRELISKTALLPGLAVDYMAKDNPFFENHVFVSFLAYSIDFFWMIPAFGGAFFGKTMDDKIGIAAIGFSALASYRILSYLFLKIELDNYNKIKNSGYRIPRVLQNAT